MDNSNNNCIIGLCVYNNEPGLPSVLSNILKISESKLFEKITVVAFYDYSSDNSHSIMENFKRQYSNIIEMVIIINKSNADANADAHADANADANADAHADGHGNSHY